jgi:hypothetical protein
MYICIGWCRYATVFPHIYILSHIHTHTQHIHVYMHWLMQVHYRLHTLRQNACGHTHIYTQTEWHELHTHVHAYMHIHTKHTCVYAQVRYRLHTLRQNSCGHQQRRRWHQVLFMYVCVCMYVCGFQQAQKTKSGTVHACMYVCMYVWAAEGWHHVRSCDLCMYVCMHVCMYVNISSGAMTLGTFFQCMNTYMHIRPREHIAHTYRHKYTTYIYNTYTSLVIVYACIYACMWAKRHRNQSTYIYVPTGKNKYPYTYKHTCLHTHLDAYVCIHICTYVYTHMHTHMYTRVDTEDSTFAVGLEEFRQTRPK